MRKLLLLLFLIPTLSIGQTRISNDTLFVNDKVFFVIDQKIQLGMGSNVATKEFNFIYSSPTNFLAPMVHISSHGSGSQMTIWDFKKTGNKKRGEKYYLIIDNGIIKYWCEIEPALETKEIIVKGYNDTDEGHMHQASSADELKKWKDLLDNGAITKDEYEVKKSKILNNK